MKTVNLAQGVRIVLPSGAVLVVTPEVGAGFRSVLVQAPALPTTGQRGRPQSALAHVLREKLRAGSSPEHRAQCVAWYADLAGISRAAAVVAVSRAVSGQPARRPVPGRGAGRPASPTTLALRARLARQEPVDLEWIRRQGLSDGAARALAWRELRKRAQDLAASRS